MNILLTKTLRPSNFLKKGGILYKSFRCYEYDVIVIGGGITGTAIAKTVKENIKHASVALLEKEQDLGYHQSSHNSKVVHAGFYYRPDSLKAKLCVEGANLIYDYCDAKNIPYKKYGKVIIGTDPLDIYRLRELYKRGLQNKVAGLELLEKWKDVDLIQPNCRGIQALWSPNSGNIDWEVVTKSFGNDFKNEGGEVFFNCEVKCVREFTQPSHPLLIEDTKNNIFCAKCVIICLGLHSGSLFDSDKDDCYKNISLKVNYHLLNPKLNRFIKTNIYGMPHLDMPFLGIHISPTPDGNVLLGPSAVPALKLDGYENNAIDMHYVQNNVFSKGFALLFLKNFQSCLSQFTETVFGDVRTSALKKYFPMIAESDILPGPSAVQGQVVTNDGEFIDDFLIEVFEGSGIQKRIVNCRFIPSPGATSSLAIAQMINKEIAKLGI